MKKLFFVCAVLWSLGLFADEELICEQIDDEAKNICTESICEEVVAEGYECTKDGDFTVAVYECAYEEEKDLVEKYNKENLKKQINCDDY